jgi:hypothetical protein
LYLFCLTAGLSANKILAKAAAVKACSSWPQSYKAQSKLRRANTELAESKEESGLRFNANFTFIFVKASYFAPNPDH